MQPFLQQALEDIATLRTNDWDDNWDDDWWKYAIQSVDFFRACFEVSWPIEIVRDLTPDLGVVGNASYHADCSINPWTLGSSEITLQSFPDFPNGVPRRDHLISGLAHEVWHAHQIMHAARFGQTHDWCLDLEQIDPLDSRNRGAVYYLSNVLLYEPPTMGNFHYYKNQICEAEALYIQAKITEVLA